MTGYVWTVNTSGHVETWLVRFPVPLVVRGTEIFRNCRNGVGLNKLLGFCDGKATCISLR